VGGQGDAAVGDGDVDAGGAGEAADNGLAVGGHRAGADLAVHDAGVVQAVDRALGPAEEFFFVLLYRKAWTEAARFADKRIERARGLKLPDDLAMIVFDDHDVFRLYPPGITCIRQPAEEIAKTALELLMDQLGKGSNTGGETKIEVSPGLVIRGTTEFVQKVK